MLPIYSHCPNCSTQWSLVVSDCSAQCSYRVDQKKLGSQKISNCSNSLNFEDKSIVIPLNQMSQSGEKHAQD